MGSWLLELGLVSPPGACPYCCLVCVVTWKVVYASVLSVVFGFSFAVLVAIINACSFLLQRHIVGRVFTVFLGCCILFLGSAIGCWLFAVTVYWMFGSVACLLVGFFFYVGCCPVRVHDTALVSLWGCR